MGKENEENLDHNKNNENASTNDYEYDSIELASSYISNCEQDTLGQPLESEPQFETTEKNRNTISTKVNIKEIVENTSRPTITNKAISLDAEPFDITPAACEECNFFAHFGKKVQRTGRIFSFTFWRTEIKGEVFWSVQGNSNDGSVWVYTRYFGPTWKSSQYLQEVILKHPTEKDVRLHYMSPLSEEANSIRISKKIIHLFRTRDNKFIFQFRIFRVEEDAVMPREVKKHLFYSLLKVYS